MSLQSSHLSFPRLAMLLLGVLAFGMPGCGDSEPEKTAVKSPEEGNESPQTNESDAKKPQSNNNAKNTPSTNESLMTDDPASQLRADLNDAVSLLAKGDSVTFIERYMPVDYLEQMTIEQMVSMLNANHENLLGELREMQTGEIVFSDKQKLLARFEIKPSQSDLAPPELGVTNPADEKVPSTEGFAGDIQETIGEAIAALEAKEYQKFIENMFPPSEMYLTTSDEKMQALLLRLEEHPQMAEQMLADLKALQKLKPEMDKQQLTATFQLNEGIKQARTVKFEKSRTWRFANTANEVRTQIYQQAQQMLSDEIAPTKIEWIRIRDHWRLRNLD